MLDEAEATPAPSAGHLRRPPFEDFRDIDDLTASFFEVLTSTGKYYWIPMERVEMIEFHAPERPRDLLWRRAHMVVRGGPDGEVFLPALYAGSHADPDDAYPAGPDDRLARRRGAPGPRLRPTPVSRGRRSPRILELKEITVTDPVSGSDHGENDA